MTKRWFIYKDDKPTGPYSALEIRQLLREGVVDPFDFVSQDGSQLKLELVEVDEIFSNENISYDGSQQAASGDSGFVAKIADRSYSDKQKSVPYDSSTPTIEPTAPRSSPASQLAIASDMRKIGKSGNVPEPISQAYAASKKKRRDPKRYHLIDPKGRVLGPLSPGEIQSLYYRGVVDKNVKVMRDGSNSSVAIAKFVSAYAEAQGMPKTPKQGGHPIIQGVSNSALNRLALMRRAEAISRRVSSGLPPLAIGIIVVAVLLIALAIGLLIRDGTLFDGFRDTKTSQQQRPVEKPPVKVQQKTNREKNKISPKKIVPKKARKEPSVGSGVLARPRGKIRPSTPQRMQPRSRYQPRNNRSTPKVKTQIKRPDSPYRMSPGRPYVKPMPVMTRPMTQPLKPVSAPPKKLGPTVGSLVDGQSVSGLGPMQYSRDAVKSCDGSCTITFTGAGGSVSVAFFKNVWGTPLLSKKGGVYISGLVRKNGGSTKILLNGVR